MATTHKDPFPGQWSYIRTGAPIEELRHLQAACVMALEQRFPALTPGQTRLEFSHIDEREFTLLLTNPSLAGVALATVFPRRHCHHDAREAYIDFPYIHSKADVLRELLRGLGVAPSPHPAGLCNRHPHP